MDLQSSMRPARPQSVKELVAQAETFKFNTNIPFKHWSRAAETLYQEAYFALSDGDYGRAYMMLYRHSTLVAAFLPQHPQFKDPENRNLFKPLSKRLDRVIKDLELLKPEIDEAYQEWERMVPPAARDQSKDQTAPRSYANFASRDPSLSGNAKILDASEHQDLAVDLAQEELTRRDTARRATRQAGGGASSRPSDIFDLQRQMEAARLNLNLSDPGRPNASEYHSRESRSQPVPSHYNYPSISKSRPVELNAAQDHESSLFQPRPQRPPKEELPPQRPHKGYADSHTTSHSHSPKPQLPRKLAIDEYQALEPSRPHAVNEYPPVPRKEDVSLPPIPKKERLTFKPGAYLENGDPIRSLFIPSKLRQSFLEIAAEHTKAGLEMCGMLCGAPINNALFVRCLLIPDQKSTSDTCETENEGALFDYCISEDLMILGWIHTHPTQTCFMSSRDLHTHAGYQVMMPESVAIVCAPKFTPSYGTFRLTHPPGLNHILDCHHTDTFHQHSIGNLYREAEHPQGHVYESDKMPFYVHDLRTK